jgi:D-sedoheptulose 7-phosphate isomerase
LKGRTINAFGVARPNQGLIKGDIIINMSAKQIAQQIIECFERGGKILLMGNGGSASMSQHWAGEFINKFERDRLPLPAIALTTDTSVLTSISNDSSFKEVFARQIYALGKISDLVIGISTSGKSENVLIGLRVAEQNGIDTIDLPRKGKGTAKIQEYQLKLMHDITRIVEKYFA